MPRVFRGRTDIQSDIWQQEVTFERGHLYLIEAVSGTGKSSLCSYLIGYRGDYEGSMCFDGRDIRELCTYDWTMLRQRSLSTMFQELRVFPELTAWENVQVKNQLTHYKSNTEIAAYFETLGIADKRDTRLGHLSYGQ